MEKRFEPSKKRLEKARREGNVAKSQYLSQYLVTIAGLLICLAYIANSWVEHKILLQYLWTEGLNSPAEAARIVLGKYAMLVVKLLAILAVTGILSEFAQVGVSIEPGLLGFKLERVDPFGGTKKLFENLKRSWQVVLRLVIVIVVLSWFFTEILGELAGSMTLISASAPAIGFGWVKKLILYMAVCLLGLGLFDYYLQKRKWFQSVGMSFEDMRQEHKDDEGDPHIKAARKAQHQELLRQNLVKRIRSSRVIIVERAS